jgi:beta-phosphoglucomutase-like phosphatase (HAD superfamily)
MNPGALIFDVDGTLADTEELHRRAFNEAFMLHGLDWNWSQPEYAQLLRTAGGKERIAAYIDSLELSPMRREQLHEQIPAIHRTKTVLYTRLVDSGAAPLRDGIARLLDEARMNEVPVAIATTTTFDNIEALLTATLGPAAMSRFAAIGSAESAPRKKPAPDVYLHVLQALSLPPERCVAFEDSANGLQAALSAGLFTVVTPSFWTRDEPLQEADLLLPSLGSPDQPLPPSIAETIGASQVSLSLIGGLLEKRGQRGQRGRASA